jgi:hypothetical protein
LLSKEQIIKIVTVKIDSKENNNNKTKNNKNNAATKIPGFYEFFGEIVAGEDDRTRWRCGGDDGEALEIVFLITKPQEQNQHAEQQHDEQQPHPHQRAYLSRS